MDMAVEFCDSSGGDIFVNVLFNCPIQTFIDIGKSEWTASVVILFDSITLCRSEYDTHHYCEIHHRTII